MQNKKLLTVGVGALAVVAVVGVAVSYNQGGLFKGALTAVPVDYTTELAASGQKMDARFIQVPAADGKKYTLFGDKRLVESQSLTIEDGRMVINRDNLKTAGFGEKLYMQFIEAPTDDAGVRPSGDSPYPESTRLKSTTTEEAATIAPARMEIAPAESTTTTTTTAPVIMKRLPVAPVTEPATATAAPATASLDADQMRYLQNYLVPVANAQDAVITSERRSLSGTEVKESANAIKVNLDKALVFRLDQLADKADGDYVVAAYKGLDGFTRFPLRLTSTPVKAAAPVVEQSATRTETSTQTTTTPTRTTTTTTTTPTATTTTTTSTTSTTPTPVATKPSAEPCIVDGKTFYLAQGPNSAYCKDLQATKVFQSDLAPETPQVRYTTALAAQRILSDIIESQDLDARIRIKNLSGDWYKTLRDSQTVVGASSQEQTDFKSVYASSILKGRRDINTGEITLAPLERIKFIELLSLLKQALASVIGYTPNVADSRMPAFALEYKKDVNQVWMYEAIAFGIEFNMITKDEVTATSIQGLAQRSDMASFLNKFKSAIEKDPTLLER